MLANIALPSFLPHSLATLIGILVIAAIEGWFVMRILHLRYAESYRHALSANWKSTVTGIPVAWLLWVAGLIPISMGLTMFGPDTHPAVVHTALQTIFLGGMMPTEWTHVGTAAAWIVMLIPFWMGSVWIERRTLMKRLPHCDPAQISRAIVRANLASYSLFLLLGVIGLANALADLPNQKLRFQEQHERNEAYRKGRGRVEVPSSRTESQPMANHQSARPFIPSSVPILLSIPPGPRSLR